MGADNFHVTESKDASVALEPQQCLNSTPPASKPQLPWLPAPPTPQPFLSIFHQLTPCAHRYGVGVPPGLAPLYPAGFAWVVSPARRTSVVSDLLPSNPLVCVFSPGPPLTLDSGPTTHSTAQPRDASLSVCSGIELGMTSLPNPKTRFSSSSPTSHWGFLVPPTTTHDHGLSIQVQPVPSQLSAPVSTASALRPAPPPVAGPLWGPLTSLPASPLPPRPPFSRRRQEVYF